MNSNADLDRLLISPVGLSLRSAGGAKFAGKQRYKNRDEANELFNAWYLDIWANSKGRVLDDLRQLYTDRDGWVKSISDPEYGHKPNNGDTLRLRIILTRPPQDGKYPWPKFHDQGPAGHKQIYYRPFFERDLKALFLAWKLPTDWLYLRSYAKGCGNYARKISWDGALNAPEQMTFIVNFPFVLSPSRKFTSREAFWEYPEEWEVLDPRRKMQEEEQLRNGDHFIWSVCLSYWIKDGTTRALFDGFTERVTEDLCERLRVGSCLWSDHPLNLPITLLDIYVGCATAQVKDVDYRYYLIEGTREATKDFADNFSNLVDVERMLDFSLRLAHFLVDSLASLQEAEPETWSQQVKDGKALIFENVQFAEKKIYIQHVTRQMEESLKNTIEFLKNQIHYVAGLQKRNSNDLGVLQANVSQEISEESRQDSASMMTISILGMAFLPATAVAAICSMGVFDWSQPQGVTVSPHFWIFWAIVLPLTFLLMACWFSWYFLYRKPKIEFARQKLGCEACSDARAFGSELHCREHREKFSFQRYWRRQFSNYLRESHKKEPKSDSKRVKITTREGLRSYVSGHKRSQYI